MFPQNASKKIYVYVIKTPPYKIIACDSQTHIISNLGLGRRLHASRLPATSHPFRPQIMSRLAGYYLMHSYTRTKRRTFKIIVALYLFLYTVLYTYFNECNHVLTLAVSDFLTNYQSTKYLCLLSVYSIGMCLLHFQFYRNSH